MLMVYLSLLRKRQEPSYIRRRGPGPLGIRCLVIRTGRGLGRNVEPPAAAQKTDR